MFRNLVQLNARSESKILSNKDALMITVETGTQTKSRPLS